eukprot:6486910-Amphidinium_carterae.1
MPPRANKSASSKSAVSQVTPGATSKKAAAKPAEAHASSACWSTPLEPVPKGTVLEDTPCKAKSTKRKEDNGADGSKDKKQKRMDSKEFARQCTKLKAKLKILKLKAGLEKSKKDAKEKKEKQKHTKTKKDDKGERDEHKKEKSKKSHKEKKDKSSKGANAAISNSPKHSASRPNDDQSIAAAKGSVRKELTPAISLKRQAPAATAEQSVASPSGDAKRRRTNPHSHACGTGNVGIPTFADLSAADAAHMQALRVHRLDLVTLVTTSEIVAEWHLVTWRHPHLTQQAEHSQARHCQRFPAPCIPMHIGH